MKYIVTNACGHSKMISYVHCGTGHDDSVTKNEECFLRAYKDTITRPTSICVGTEFCNKGCRALHMGWMCCTCGFKKVEGFYHTGLKMVVHTTEDRINHALCNLCMDAGPVNFRDLDPVPYSSPMSSGASMPSLSSPSMCRTNSSCLNDEDGDEDRFHDAVSSDHSHDCSDEYKDDDTYTNGFVSSDVGQHPVGPEIALMLMNMTRGTDSDTTPVGPKEKGEYDYYAGTASRFLTVG